MRTCQLIYSIYTIFEEHRKTKPNFDERALPCKFTGMIEQWLRIDKKLRWYAKKVREIQGVKTGQKVMEKLLEVQEKLNLRFEQCSKSFIETPQRVAKYNREKETHTKCMKWFKIYGLLIDDYGGDYDFEADMKKKCGEFKFE